MKSVFISYNHRDKPFVSRLEKDLTSLGIKIWLDERELSIGDSILKKIAKGISNTDFLIATISSNSNKSGWVERELDIAMNYEINNRKVKVLPIIIDECEIPEFLIGKLYANFRQNKDYKESLTKVAASILGITPNERIIGNILKEANLSIKTNTSLINKINNRLINIDSGSLIMKNVDKDSSNPYSIEGMIVNILVDKYPITQDIFIDVMEYNPSYFIGENLPVENVYWKDTIEFCIKLSKMYGLEPAYEIDYNNRKVNWIKNSNGFRLLTEYEWEYICKSNNPRDFSISDIAWYRNNSNQSTNPVGQKKPNNWGIYDMLGNLWEWLWDPFSLVPNPIPVKNQYFGVENNEDRVLRGGSWSRFARDCQCDVRDLYSVNDVGNAVGFRICRNN